MDNRYQPGDLVPLTATFKNASGTPTNTTVVLTVIDPTGAEQTVTTSNPSAGVYTANFNLGATPPYGVWEYIFSGTGTVQATERDTFLVERKSLVERVAATALTTLADAREFVFRDPTDNAKDTELVRLINSYSRAVYTYTKREWLPQTNGATRKLQYNGGGFLRFMVPNGGGYDLRTATAIVAYTNLPTSAQITLDPGTTTTYPQYQLWPVGKTPQGTYIALDLPTSRSLSPWGSMWADFPYNWPYLDRSAGFEISITGDWGIASSLAGVPEDVQLATLIAVKDAYENPAGYSTGTFMGQSFTEEPESTGDYYRARNLPGESRALLTEYRRPEVPAIA